MGQGGLSRYRLSAPLSWREENLPYPDFPRVVKAAVTIALRTAWLDICDELARVGLSVLDESEPAITTRLQKSLNSLLDDNARVPAFSGAVFQTVSRDESVTNYNSERLEKKPDLTFRIINTKPGIDRTLHGFYVECKLVRTASAIKSYDRDGIGRFVEGDYAWAMRSGMMIAYAASFLEVPAELSAYLEREKSLGRSSCTDFSTWLEFESSEPALLESLHRRDWTYPRTGQAPGQICLLHLWLQIPETRSREAGAISDSDR